MKIIDLLHQKVNEWNESNECGICWEFFFGTLDLANTKKLKESNKCCVHFIVNLLESEVKITSNQNGSTKREYIEHSLTIFCGIPSRIDIQLYNERDYPLNESKYEQYLKPIYNCLETGINNLCKLDESLELSYWKSKQPFVNYVSQNLDGIKINCKIKQYDRA